MTALTTYSGTPEDLKAMLMEVVAPLTDRIRELEIAAGNRKHAYTVAEVAEQIGYAPKTVLSFIKKGRKGLNGKDHRLKAREITTNEYRIKPEDLESWLSHF